VTGVQTCALPIWTLGGQQVGRAAIAGWRELLQPALTGGAPAAALWPFDGDLGSLLARGGVVVVETYPAEVYGHLGVRLGARWGGGKRSPAARRANAPVLRRAASELGVVLDPSLAGVVDAGFPEPAGDDGFDAVVGLLGVLEVVCGGRPAGEPACPRIRGVEGWILGQAPA